MKDASRYGMMVDLCVRLKDYEAECEAQNDNIFDIYDKKTDTYFVFNSNEQIERVLFADIKNKASDKYFKVLNMTREGLTKTANGFVFTDTSVTMIAWMLKLNALDRKYEKQNV